jgi:TetR/AcrR family transcriptional repressor of mexJK operon
VEVREIRRSLRAALAVNAFPFQVGVQGGQRLRRPATIEGGMAAKKKNLAGRPSAEELERRKAKVMQVATGLFVKQGYAGTSLLDIAKGAGVAMRTLYQHFGDKEAIFKRVLFARDQGVPLAPPALRADEDLQTSLMRMARYACDTAFHPPTIDLTRLAVAESKRFPAMISKLISGSHARFRVNMQDLFDDLAARGLVEDKDTRACAYMFVDLILGDLPLLTVGGWAPPAPTDEQLREKIALFTRGRWDRA